MSTTSFPPRQPFLYRHKKSQAAVEFAISFPILLTILFGIIDFSLLFASWFALQNLVRQAVRFAATGFCPSTIFPSSAGYSSAVAAAFVDMRFPRVTR